MSTDDNTTSDTSDSSSYRIKFIILLALIVPSIAMSFTIFIHFATSRAVRAIDHQHSVIVLLIITLVQVLTDIPMVLDFYRFGGVVRLQTAAYCQGWTTIDFSLFAAGAYIMAWISIERHLMIFHRPWLGADGSWKKWWLHVAPWIICPMCPISFYALAIDISPMCTSLWSSSAFQCGGPCYLATNWAAVDIFINVVFPIAIIITANLALIIRVIHQRKTVGGRAAINWRRQRKMVLQLGAISVWYLSVWLPIATIQLTEFYIDPTFLSAQVGIVVYLDYIALLILPAVCMPSIPQLFKRLSKVVGGVRGTSIVPAGETNRRSRLGHDQRMAAANSTV